MKLGHWGFGLILVSAAAPARAEAPPVQAPPAEAPAAAPSAALPPAEPHPAPEPSPAPSLFGRPIRREGFHFHADLGVGAGDSLAGLYHSMELGWSFSGYSVSLLHSLIQYRSVFGQTDPSPHEIGGFFLQAKGPLYFQDLSWKFAAGVGGSIDQSNGGFVAHPGFGMHYGVDLHLPIWPKFGPTLSVSALTVEDGTRWYFGGAAALGVTVF